MLIEIDWYWLFLSVYYLYLFHWLEKQGNKVDWLAKIMIKVSLDTCLLNGKGG